MNSRSWRTLKPNRPACCQLRLNRSTVLLYISGNKSKLCDAQPTCLSLQPRQRRDANQGALGTAGQHTAIKTRKSVMKTPRCWKLPGATTAHQASDQLTEAQISRLSPVAIHLTVPHALAAFASATCGAIATATASIATGT